MVAVFRGDFVADRFFGRIDVILAVYVRVDGQSCGKTVSTRAGPLDLGECVMEVPCVMWYVG